MPNAKQIPSNFQQYIEENYLKKHCSLRMVANHFNVDHSTASRWMKSIGITPFSKNSIAKYTWKNHKHPDIGRKGKLSYMYGRHLSEATKEKIRRANLGPNNWHWCGGTKKHSGGYILIYFPDHPAADRQGFVLEHRVVMENYLGRYLRSNEIVHHINQDKTDNRIENLMLLTRSQHAHLHQILKGENHCA
jgi:hypothetical protein